MTTVPKPTAWQDWAVPSVLLAWAQGEIWVHGATLLAGPRWLFALVASGCSVALLIRRAHPVTAAVCVVALLICPVAFGWYAESIALALMLVVALFAAGRYGSRPAAYLVVPVAALVVLLESFPNPNEDLASSWQWSLNAVWLFALGAAFRHEERLRAQVAQAAEAGSRAEAAQERIRVARELHDILSHSLAVIVVQAEVADTYLDSDPARSRQAILSVAATGRSALSDTRKIVGLLRDPDTGVPSPPLPGLSDVPALIDRIRESGLPVSLQMGDSPPALAAEVAATAYRVVQEALTNVLRHAGKVPTEVGVAYTDGAVIVAVRNKAGEAVPPTLPAGHGLLGMRERVISCGGELTSGSDPQGGFSVRAVLPDPSS